MWSKIKCNKTLYNETPASEQSGTRSQRNKDVQHADVQQMKNKQTNKDVQPRPIAFWSVQMLYSCMWVCLFDSFVDPTIHFMCHLQDVLSSILDSADTLKRTFCNIAMSALSDYNQLNSVLEKFCMSNDTALEVSLSSLNQVDFRHYYTHPDTQDSFHQQLAIYFIENVLDMQQQIAKIEQ